jgi:hypothetical protein
MDFPLEITDLLEELIFFNTVPSNNKICFKSKTTVSSSLGWGSLYRWLHGENSEDLIEKIDKLLDDSSRVINSENYVFYKHHIFKQLEIMKNSITRLKATYNNDPDTKTKLEVRFAKLCQICKIITNEDRKIMMELGEITTNFTPRPSFNPYTPSPPPPYEMV